MTLPHITKKQQEILSLLYRFRFLHRIQIQHLLNHKDYKTINLWLKDLTQKEYITRIYENSFQKHNKPAQYYIAKNGIKYFKKNSIFEKKYINKFYKESKTTEKFRERCMFIADIYLKLKKLDEKELTFFTQSDFPTEGVIRDIMPSFGFIQNNKNKKQVYIAELFRAGQPRYFMRLRIKKYIEFFAEEQNTALLFICPSETVQKYLLRFTQKLLSEDESPQVSIQITTENNIRDYEWDEVIWQSVESQE